MAESNETKIAYVGRIQAQMKEWGSQIARWQNKAHAGAEQQLITELNARRQAVLDQLAIIKDAAEDEWQDMTGEVDSAVREMQHTVNRARSLINGGT